MALSDSRDDRHADAIHLLVMDGIAECFTDCSDSAFWGTAWIGAGRDVKPGLTVPPELVESLSTSTWRLEANQARFRIVDHDGTLATLFATQAIVPDILSTWVTPNTVLGATIAINGADSIDPANRHIGLESISASRGRRNNYLFPGVTGPGLDHPVDVVASGVLPPVYVTSQPYVWEGRRVALYRLVADRSSTAAFPANYSTFAAQYTAGALIWWGTMRQHGTLRGNREWEIACAGAESWRERKLHQLAPRAWYPVSASVVLSTADGSRQDGVGITFGGRGYIDASDTNTYQTYHGKWFRSGDELTATTVQGLRSQIATLITDAVAGTNVNITGASALSAAHNASAAMLADGSLTIRQDQTGPAELYGKHARITLHNRVWRALGYEPLAQTALPHADPRRIAFTPAEAAGVLNPITGPDYWTAHITTNRLAELNTLTPEEWDNDGIARVYVPIYTGGADVLMRAGAQQIRILPGDDGDAFATAGPLVQTSHVYPPGATKIDGTDTCTAAGLWLFSGSILTASDTEPRPLMQVAKCSWVDQGGRVAVGDDIYPAMIIDRWLDPRSFGLPHLPIWHEDLAVDWASAGQETVIRCTPLGAVGLAQDSTADVRYWVWLSLLAGTGTSAGWSGVEGTSPTLDAGTNDLGLSRVTDRWPADMGLAIPSTMIDADSAPWANVSAEGWSGPVARWKYAGHAAFSAGELLDGLLAGCGLGESLHGKRYGVFDPYAIPSQEDVSVTIGEADLASDRPPTTEIRAAGSVDLHTIRYRHAPTIEETSLEERIDARDSQARTRASRIDVSIVDPGMPGWRLFKSNKGAAEVLGTSATWWTDLDGRFGSQIPDYLAKPHWLLEGLHVARPKADSIRPGTVVSVTNPWPLNPRTATYGITAAIGRVIKVARKRGGDAVCSVLIYSDGQGARYYAPIALAYGYDSSTRVLYCRADWRGVGGSWVSDLTGFVEPAWSSAGGSMIVRLYRYNRGSLQAGPTGTVSSVDTSAHTITLTGGGLSSTYYVDSDYLVIPADYDTASQAAWAKAVLGFVVLASNLKGGSVPTVGAPYHLP